MPLPSYEPTVPFDNAEPPLGGQWGRYVVVGRLGAGGMGIVLLAHDPALDRKVALKLLRRSRSLAASQTATRLELEAQAMARLAHPNVVAVFEVDRIDDQTFVAMELVEGATLRGWLNERHRPWREIVDMFIAAGHGLAAVHDAGLVHRDFKPDNVLIGRDGRPRVSDFGLVSGAVGDSAGDAPGDAVVPAEAALPEIDATVRGTASGTPAYMPPEQWAGQPVDKRGDQFAFCVALWEALWGRRPFPGTTLTELRAAVCAGELTEPSRRPRIPHALQAALRRGLARDPAARWPHMPALLHALARTTGIRRRRITAAITATVAVVPAAIAILVVSPPPAADPCAAPAARLATVWNPARRIALGAKLAAVDPALGAVRFAKITSALDRGAQDWSAMHVEACRATRVDGRQSDSLFDRRMGCLERWFGELGDTVAVIEQAGDRAAIDHALRAATSLSPLAACADLHALGEALPPPTDPAQRATAAAVTRRAEELEVEQRAGRLDGLPAKVRDLVAAARLLDHPPTLVAALAVRARIDFAVGDEGDAETALRELAQIAARARDDRRAAFAWTNLISVVGWHLGRPGEALALVPIATAAVLRAGEPPDLRAELLFNQGTVVLEGPRAADGLALLTQARDLLAQATATTPDSLLLRKLADVVFQIGVAHARLGNDDAAIAGFRDAIARWRALSGEDSADEAFGWQNIAAVLQRAGKLDDALAAFRTAARIREARLGESPMTATSLVAVASVLHDQGHWNDALATYDRALAIDRAQLPRDDLRLTKVLLGRAITLQQLGRIDEAARSYDDALALFERASARPIDLPIALYNRGELQATRGRCNDAVRDYARAAALFEELRGANAALLIYPLVGEAACRIQSGHPRDAFALLERALRLPGDASDPVQVALARAYLGRAHVETKRDVARSLAMVRSARPTIAASKTNARELRDLDRWLAAHTR